MAIGTSPLAAGRWLPRLRVSRANLTSWIAAGTLVGALPALAFDFGVRTNRIVYGVVGVSLASFLPWLVRLAGSVEQLLLFVFFLSLQIQLEFAPIISPYRKPAGPYGIQISLILLAGAALVLTHACKRLWHRATPLALNRRLVKASAWFLATGLVSSLFSPDKQLSLFGLFEIASVVLTGLLACHYCATRPGILSLRTALYVGIIIQSVLILTEQTLGVQISLARGISTHYEWGSDAISGRYAGLFGAPASASIFLTIGLLFLFGHLFSSKKPPRHFSLLLGIFTLGFLAVLITRTRSTWIAFTIASAGLAWRYYHRGTLSRRVLRRMAIGALLALAIAWPLVASRLSQDHAGSADTRESLVFIALAMIKANPLVGVGLNAATNQVYTYAAMAGVSGTWVFVVHNQFLLIAAEMGLPAFAAFIYLVWVGLSSAYRCMQAEDVFIRETAAVLLWSLVAMIWALNLDFVTGSLTYSLFWFIIGVASGLRVLMIREDRLSVQHDTAQADASRMAVGF